MIDLSFQDAQDVVAAHHEMAFFDRLGLVVILDVLLFAYPLEVVFETALVEVLFFALHPLEAGEVVREEEALLVVHFREEEVGLVVLPLEVGLVVHFLEEEVVLVVHLRGKEMVLVVHSLEEVLVAVFVVPLVPVLRKAAL